MSDVGIIAEIIGFILLLLVGNRNPNSVNMVGESHKPHWFDTKREKIILDKYVNFFLPFSIGIIIMGLIFQSTYFNPTTIINS